MTFLLLSGWTLALYFAAHWVGERDRADMAEMDADMQRASHEAARQVIAQQDAQLAEAHRLIAELRDKARVTINDYHHYYSEE
jgi:hypothetical protein